MLKKYFITVSLITTILSCHEEIKKPDSKHIENMPTNHINAWSDGCGFSFELLHDSIYALSGTFIKYERLNDSLFNVIYPKYPMIVKDTRIDIYENNRFISFSNSGLTCCLDKNNNEIIFGADRLKFQKLSDNSVKIYYPEQSRWKISRVSDKEILIYNETNRTRYIEFRD